MQTISLKSAWAEEEKRASLHRRLEEDNVRDQEKKFVIDPVHEIVFDVIEIGNGARWTRIVKESKKSLEIETGTETEKRQASRAVSMKEIEN